VKSCRALFLLLVSPFINENRLLYHDFLLLLLFLLLFLEKWQHKKNQKNLFSIFFIFIKSKGLHFLFFTKIHHKSCAD